MQLALFLNNPSLIHFHDLARSAMLAAIGVIGRGDFTYVDRAHGFRVELVAKDGVDPLGLRGAIFRIVTSEMKIYFAVPTHMVEAARQSPSHAGIVAMKLPYQ